MFLCCIVTDSRRWVLGLDSKVIHTGLGYLYKSLSAILSMPLGLFLRQFSQYPKTIFPHLKYFNNPTNGLDVR